jgi:parvulin-like peptidyl-prolyl isomerase
MTTLATINGEALQVAAALRLSLFDEGTFLQEAVDGVLLRQYAATRGIANTDAELQLAADELRYMRGQESVETTRQWMAERHLDLLAFQDALDLWLLRNKVRHSFSSDEISAYYADHAVEYETAELYSIRVDDEHLARELAAQIHEGANFHVVAMEQSKDESTRHLGGYAGSLARGDMTGVVAAAVFSARPVSVIGPVKTEQGWNLFKVAKIHKPTVEESADRIRVALMKQLVAKLRAGARVEYPVLDAAAV